MAIKENWEITKLEENKNKKIAIIGAGPAGLTAASYLARRGFEVYIYEKHNDIGGLLRHGIPEFRLPREIIDGVVQKIVNLGVKIKLGTTLGKDLTLEELEQENDAILLCFGANISSKMGIQGEELPRSFRWK